MALSSTPRPDRPVQTGTEAGFTLVEVMISIALFGLIALAGFTLLDSELRVQSRTDGRLERIGDLQRAMYVMTGDFEQMSGPAQTADGAVTFRRYAAAPSPGELQVSYALKNGVLERTLIGVGAQRLVTDVAALKWAFYVDGAGWQGAWPASDSGLPRPSAVAIDITLGGAHGESGVLRRLVALPAAP